jgi:response regulator NasT
VVSAIEQADGRKRYAVDPLRIILAEGDKDARQTLDDALSRAGHKVVCAANGRQLVELAKVGEPDVVITDLDLPDLDGIEAAVLVSRERETPVILLAGQLSAESLARVQQDPVMACLGKPVGPDNLLAAVAVAVARFRQYQQVKHEAADLKQALADRKLIERAKGVLMKRLGLGEDEAFSRLRKLASHHNLKLAAAAQKVVEAEEVFHEMDRA